MTKVRERKKNQLTNQPTSQRNRRHCIKLMVPKFCIICSMLVRCRSFIKLHVWFEFLVWFVVVNVVISHIHSEYVRLALLVSFAVYMRLFVVLLRFFALFLARARSP